MGLAGCSGLRPEARHRWIRPMNERSVETVPDSAPTEPEPALVMNTPEGSADLGAETGCRLDPISTIPSTRNFSWVRPPEPSEPSDRTVQMAANTAQDTGFYDPRAGRGWNAVAIAALPIALIGVSTAIAFESTLLLGIAGVVALTLGLIGGRRARDRERRGKGFAIPAMIIGVGALVLTFLVLVAS